MHKKGMGEQIAEELKNRIHNGQYALHLPGELLLARDLGVSRTALRDALGFLQKEGIILKRHGKPTAIVAQKPASEVIHGVTLISSRHLLETRSPYRVLQLQHAIRMR